MKKDHLRLQINKKRASLKLLMEEQFLDEIGDMSLSAQAKVLRALQRK